MDLNINVTKELSEFVVNTHFNDLPQAAVIIAKKAFLDGISVGIAGSLEQSSQIVTRFAKKNGKGNSSILRNNYKVPSFLAALANGTMMHALDFDDQNWDAIIHPTAVIIPSLLAIGEERESPGKDILTAYILGFEAAVKVGKMVQPHHLEIGWHPTSTLCTIGSAVACGKLLNLNVIQMQYAIGNAASQACGIIGNFGTMTKPFHAGKAASNGVMAAMLAQEGLTANENIITAKLGFCEVFGKGKDRQFNLDSFNYLGNPFEIIDSGICIKKYPSCFCTHTSIDGTLKLINKHNLKSSDIDKIICIMHPRRLREVNHPEVSSPSEARFSVQYCVSVAILDGAVTMEHFKDKCFPLNNRVQEMINRVEVKGDSTIGTNAKKEIERVGSKIIIRLKNGQEYSQEITKLNLIDSNISIEEDSFLIKKFNECLKDKIEQNKVNELLIRIIHLEDISNIKNVIDLIID